MTSITPPIYDRAWITKRLPREPSRIILITIRVFRILKINFNWFGKPVNFESKLVQLVHTNSELFHTESELVDTKSELVDTKSELIEMKS
jgi:hypothetical protein